MTTANQQTDNYRVPFYLQQFRNSTVSTSLTKSKNKKNNKLNQKLETTRLT
jgi:hypothetical protein